jgi:hypothetical protein
MLETISVRMVRSFLDLAAPRYLVSVRASPA